MRNIEAKKITDAVSRMYKQANYFLPEDVWHALKNCRCIENEPNALFVFDQILENAKIATTKEIPLCQDTGIAEVFIKLGSEVQITGGSLKDAVNKGVAAACKEGSLRASILNDPLDRVNTNNNTPAQVHIDLVEGSSLEVTLLAKGGGTENSSCLKMLIPSDGRQGVKKFILDTVKEKGVTSCPPVVVGVGLGGSFSSVSMLAKKALLREIGTKNTNDKYADFEKELLTEINSLNIGPMGLGGKTTALAVHIESAPCHIASLPVAVAMMCHSLRRITEKI